MQPPLRQHSCLQPPPFRPTWYPILPPLFIVRSSFHHRRRCRLLSFPCPWLAFFAGVTLRLRVSATCAGSRRSMWFGRPDGNPCSIWLSCVEEGIEEGESVDRPIEKRGGGRRTLLINAFFLFFYAAEGAAASVTNTFISSQPSLAPSPFDSRFVHRSFRSPFRSPNSISGGVDLMRPRRRRIFHFYSFYLGGIWARLVQYFLTAIMARSMLQSCVVFLLSAAIYGSPCCKRETSSRVS